MKLTTKSTLAALVLGITGIAAANDTIALAGTGTIGSPLAWAINPAGDVDHVRYELNTRGTLRAWTTGSLDSVGEILDSAGRSIAFNDDAADTNFDVRSVLNPGTYYVKVRAYERTATGSYTLNTSFTAAPVADDHGNSTSTATRVAFANNRASATGAIERSGDVDYLMFTAPAQPGRIEFTSAGSTDVTGTIYSTAGGQLGFNDDDASSSSANFRVGATLLPGQVVYLAVRGFDTSTGAYTVNATFTPENQPIVAPAGKRALVVGISDYPGTANDLNYSDDDGREMSVLLSNAGWSVTRLIDSQGSKGAIAREIRRLAPGGGKFMIYYSGHGSASGTTGYICPADMTGYLDSMISEVEFNGYLSAAGNTEVGIIFDSCNSGAFIGRNLAGVGAPDGAKARFVRAIDAAPIDARAGEFFARNISAAGRVVITGCRGSQYSYELGALQNGWMTYHLMNAFRDRTMDTNRDRSVSLEEAFNRVSGGYRGLQSPQLYDGNGATHYRVTTP